MEAARYLEQERNGNKKGGGRGKEFLSPLCFEQKKRKIKIPGVSRMILYEGDTNTTTVNRRITV